MKKPEATERGHVQGLQSTAQLFKPPQPRCQTCGQVSFQMVPDPSIESLPAFESSQPKLQVCGPEDKPLYWETIQTSDPQNPRVHEIASRELLWEKATVGQGNTTKIGAIQTRWESQLTLLRLASFSSLSLGDWHKSRWTCVTFIHSFAISVNKAGTEKTSAQNSLAAWGTNTDVPCPGDFSHLSWGQPREKPHSQAIANPDHLGIQTEHTHTHTMPHSLTVTGPMICSQAFTSLKSNHGPKQRPLYHISHKSYFTLTLESTQPSLNTVLWTIGRWLKSRGSAQTQQDAV